MKLSPCETITDEPAFVASHEAVIARMEKSIKEAHHEKRDMIRQTMAPYKERLQKYWNLKMLQQ